MTDSDLVQMVVTEGLAGLSDDDRRRYEKLAKLGTQYFALTSEIMDMASRCSHEIRVLREEVSRLSPKAEAYDAISTILGLLPKKSQGEGMDLVWWLNKKISELAESEIAL